MLSNLLIVDTGMWYSEYRLLCTWTLVSSRTSCPGSSSMDVAMPDMVRVSKPCYLDTCIQKLFQLLSVEMDSDAFPTKFTGLGDVLLLPSSMVLESWEKLLWDIVNLPVQPFCLGCFDSKDFWHLNISEVSQAKVFLTFWSYLRIFTTVLSVLFSSNEWYWELSDFCLFELLCSKSFIYSLSNILEDIFSLFNLISISRHSFCYC